jgi:hypothetical protein
MNNKYLRRYKAIMHKIECFRWKPTFSFIDGNLQVAVLDLTFYTNGNLLHPINQIITRSRGPLYTMANSMPTNSFYTMLAECP